MRARAEIIEIVTGKDSITSSVFVEVEYFLGCSSFKYV